MWLHAIATPRSTIAETIATTVVRCELAPRSAVPSASVVGTDPIAANQQSCPNSVVESVSRRSGSPETKRRHPT